MTAAETIQLPRTIGSAQRSLEGIDGLLTAKEWERAAIVYAFTYDGQGKRTDLTSDTSIRSERVTIKDFAAKGISGLKTAVSVRAYRDAWREAGGADVRPGQKVTLPTGPFPATRTGTNGHSSEEGATTTINRIVKQHGASVVTEAIMSAPEKVSDEIFHDLKLRRAGIDTSEANRKAAAATASKLTEPFKKAMATIAADLCVDSLKEATEELQQAISENGLNSDNMARIKEAKEGFDFVWTEALFANS